MAWRAPEAVGSGTLLGARDLRLDQPLPVLPHAVNMGRAARAAALEAKLLTTSQGVGVTPAIFALKNADPEERQDRYYTETKVNVAVEQMSEAKLMAIVSGAKRPMIEAKAVQAEETVVDDDIKSVKDAPARGFSV